MITYVNTVLVSNLDTPVFAEFKNANADSLEAGQIVYQILDEATALADSKKIRIGLVTNKTNVLREKDGSTKNVKVIQWSNAIQKGDIKSAKYMVAPDFKDADSQDEVTIDFSNANGTIMNKLAEGGKRVIVRLTFKDLPTRYRKWTESYEYVTKVDDKAADIVTGLANQINGQWKRARVSAKADDAKLILTALPYDDDDAFDTINRAGKVRFNANMYFTDPAAEGWESLNKHFIQNVKITKTPGIQYPAIGKLVRDRENQAYGYRGILNRGMCTWPIIQPERQAQDSKAYDAFTLEFENMYRAADDIFRKTKQTVEIYTLAGGAKAIEGALEEFIDPVVAVEEKYGKETA